jgi:PAS domain S-box-containing protein
MRSMDAVQALEILDLAQSAFISMDEEGRITYWNIRAEETFGLTREQALGRPLEETIIPERYRERHREGLRRFLQTGEGAFLNNRVEVEAIRRDGREFPVEMTLSALAEEGGHSFYAFVRDITDRRAGESDRQRRFEELQGELRGTEQRLGVVLDALADAVTIRGADTHLMYANRAALDRMGLASVEEIAAADPRELMGRYGTYAEDGSPISMDDLPSVRVLRGEEPEPLLLRSVDPEGQENWVLLKAAALRNHAGEIEAAVTIIEDVTDSKRATQRIEFLARVSQTLAASLDYQETLRNIAGLAVPEVADWCAVDLFGPNGREPVAVAHMDPVKLEMAARLRSYEPDELDPERGLGRVMRTGEPLLYPEVPDELLVAAAIDGEHLELLRQVGMRSVAIVPMAAAGRTVGALTLVSADSGRVLDHGDLEFAGQIAERAALAVENARLYSGRVEVARTLQRSLLPEALPDVPGWEVAAFYRPVGEETVVGGDFYDLWEAGEDWLMMIGDVTGKGVRAAAVTSLVRHTAWTASDYDHRPAAILARIDAALKRRPALPVCTALCVRLSGTTCTVACGGHPPPIRLSVDGAREVGHYGTLLGGFQRVNWPEETFEMQAGEALVAFTDGVTDTVGRGGERFGGERLERVLSDSRDQDPQALCERLLTALDEFQVGAQADDTAVVVMRFTGSARRSEPTALRYAVSTGIGQR